jgi:hypothetical protein
VGDRHGGLILAAVLALGLQAARCGPPDDPADPPAPDAGDPASCADACAHLEELGCEEAEPTPEGATCEEVCEAVESSGTVTLNPACVLQIETCEEIDGCSG